MYEALPEVFWVGNALDGRNPRAIFDAGIAAVVDLAYEETPAKLPRSIVYCRFPLIDGEGNDAGLLRLAVETVVRLLSLGTPTLVCCSSGMSRSPVIAAMALSIRRREPPEESLRALVRSHPHDVSSPLWRAVLKACHG